MAEYKKTNARVIYTDGFCGLDTKEGEKENFSSSVYMKNFKITGQKKLKKRCGYVKTAENISADSYYAVNINGSDYFVYTSGSSVTALKLSDNSSVTTVTGQIINPGFFKYNGVLYIIGRGACYTFDGTQFSYKEPYIPTVAVSCSPAGSGTAYESLNILSNKARISFSPNGQTRYFQMPYNCASIISVTEDGDVLRSDEYTFIEMNKLLEITYIPDGGTPDSLVVTYQLDNNTVNSMPALGPRFCIYGGSRDTRAFAYGTDNIVRYSDVTDTGSDASYFPVDNFITVGESSGTVRALVRHYDRLIVFTDRETWYVSPSSVNYDGYAKPSFPLSPLNSTVGCAGGAAAFIDNSPVTLSYDGIYRYGKTSIRDERNAERISDKVSAYVTEDFLKNAVLLDNEFEKELWMAYNGDVLIYNYGLDVYYRYENVPAVYLFTYRGKPAFYTGTDIFRFDENCKTDDGDGISAVYESGFIAAGKFPKKRKVKRASVSVLPEYGCSVTLTVIPNRGSEESFSFSGDDVIQAIEQAPYPVKPVCKEKRAHLSSFESVGIRLSDSGANGGATVVSVALTLDRA